MNLPLEKAIALAYQCAFNQFRMGISAYPEQLEQLFSLVRKLSRPHRYGGSLMHGMKIALI